MREIMTMQHGHWTTTIEVDHRLSRPYRVTTESGLRHIQPRTHTNTLAQAKRAAAEHMEEVAR